MKGPRLRKSLARPAPQSGTHWLVRAHRRKDEKTLLEEYKAVRAEVTTSMQGQTSILAFGAATLGFAFAAASQTANERFRDMFLLVLVPLLCYLVLTVWFAEVMRMLRAGTFLMRLEKRLDEQFGFGALTWESTVFLGRCKRGPMAVVQDPDKFRTLAITLLFLAIAVTSIVIGWDSAAFVSWQHVFAVGALAVAVAVLGWLNFLQARDVRRLASPPLCEGDEGDAVEWVQTLLAAEGLYDGQADKVFGPLTTEAVCAFQKREGLEEDGTVGMTTMILLEELEFRPPRKPKDRSRSGLRRKKDVEVAEKEHRGRSRVGA